MKFSLKKLFIPHEDNEHHPHILRTEFLSVFLCVAIVSFGIFASSNVLRLGMWNPNGYLADVLPSVLVDLANVDRSQNSLVGLTISPILAQAAQAKVDDMVAKSYFAHKSPEGLNSWHWFDLVGYNYSYAGENLAIDFQDSNDVNVAWMNSPTHRANILNGNFTEIGIATGVGMYEGKKTIFVAQMFGRPSSSILRKSSPVVPPARVSVSTTSSQVPKNIQIASSTISQGNGQSETFVAVARPDVLTGNPEVLGAESPDAVASVVIPYASTIAHIVTNPRNIIQTMLLVIAAIIIFSLISMLVVAFSMKRIFHIIFAIVVILITIGFFIALKGWFVTALVV